MNNRNGNRRRFEYDNVKSKKQTVNVPDGAQTLAMVYGISQNWRKIDDTECGFSRGTIFDELDKPFFGDKCKRNGK